MPRIRYLKPEFFTDEDLAELPFQTRLLFAGLWCHADKEGRLEYRPKYLKAMIFPYDLLDIEKEIEALATAKGSGKSFIRLYYTPEGFPLIQIINWAKHQKTHHTEKPSRLPPPPDFPPTPPLKRRDMENQLEASLELKNRELTVKDPLKDKNNNKIAMGEFKNVLLTQEEFNKLTKGLSLHNTEALINELSSAIASKGYQYKSHYATILNWNRRKTQEKSPKTESRWKE